MARHPMSPVDAAWYHMDGPANRAMVVGVSLTRRPLDFKKVRSAIEQRLLHFARFRQRVVESGLVLPTLEWEDVEQLDIDQHVRHAALPAPHDEKALMALVNELASVPLDPTRPLWQMHVVDHFKTGSALITRYHHCIADGTAMMAVATHLFEMGPNATPQALRKAAGSGASPGLVDTVGLVLRGAGQLVAELLRSADPRSPFKGDFGAQKSVAWSKPVALEDVKAIGALAGAKVNDVLVAATAGALRSYLKRRGIDADHTTLRAMVPVDLRPPQRLGQLGNEFGLVILDLPVSVARREQRLALTKARMDALKRSPEAMAMQFLFDVFGRGPKRLEDLASVIFGSKTSIVMTNVAGPREPIALTGVPLERMMFCVPHPGDQLGMGVSIMSYRGMATLTVICDAGLVPDPQRITEGFDREFEAMRRKAAEAATRRDKARARLRA
jgi:WS/DGAT/MGAT family acyltransferase